MDITSGKPIIGIEHLRQSVRDILTTPLGSRVMRRNYGSRLFDLIDSPINEVTLVEIYAATAAALMQWEPRIRVNRVFARKPQSESTVEIDLEAVYIPTGQPIRLDGILIS
jgi:phage baseplate assembly protein W